MTWPEIKSTLVRRWPEKFITCEFDGCEMRYLVRPRHDVLLISDSLDSISAICEAIGAVVESRFCVETGKENRVLWGWTICVDVNAKHPKLIGSKKKIYDSREAAELAALGEWLKATEDK